MSIYPAWKSSYSNEDFDRTQRLAIELTNAERTAQGLPEVGGCSREDFDRARVIVRQANNGGGGGRDVEY